jgi:hypothetical protein
MKRKRVLSSFPRSTPLERINNVDPDIPVTQLRKDAVDIYISLIQREMQAIMVAESEVKPADEPALAQAVQPPPPLPTPVNAEIPRRSQGQLF